MDGQRQGDLSDILAHLTEQRTGLLEPSADNGDFFRSLQNQSNLSDWYNASNFKITYSEDLNPESAQQKAKPSSQSAWSISPEPFYAHDSFKLPSQDFLCSAVVAAFVASRAPLPFYGKVLIATTLEVLSEMIIPDRDKS